MSDTTCPHCGGPIVSNSPTCEYCGSSVSDTAMIWKRVDHGFPPKDPQNSNRSIPVITLDLSDGISFKDKRNGNIIYRYDLYEPMLISAYYDFIKKKWSNDLLGERSDEIKASHWMFIPQTTSPAWIPVDKHLPPPDHDKSLSKEMLICDQSYNFNQSVITANWGLSLHIWCCYSFTNFTTDDPFDTYTVPATHWMERPAGPTE
jgi:hypothetical protein